MGIIQRQGIKDSIVAYLGAALGAINTLFVYPAFLSQTALGLFQFLVSWAMIVSPFLLLGAPNLVVRYFPIFRDEKKGHHGFLFLMLLLPLAGFTLFCVGILLFRKNILAWLEQEVQEPLMIEYGVYILPLALFVTLNILFINYIKNFFRIVIPSFLDNVFVKIATGLLSFLLFTHLLDLFGFVYGILITYGLVTIGLLAYTSYLGQLHLKPDFSMLRKAAVAGISDTAARPQGQTLRKEMAVFGFYGILGSVSGAFMSHIDKGMISLLMGSKGLEFTGIYAIVNYIGTAIDIPRKSLEKITGPVIAQSIQEGDWSNVQKLYIKSSIIQLIAGCLLFLGIWCNLDDLFRIMPNGAVYSPWKAVVFTLSISCLIDMVTGINSQIIAYSRHFRFNFYLAIVLAGLNIVFNYLFIKTFGLGIQGAALATLTSIAIFNIVKYIFILWKFRLQPFTWKTLLVIGVSLFIFLFCTTLPDLGHPLLNILFKSLAITLLYVTALLYFQVSEDFTNLVHHTLGIFKKRFGKR